jgi:ribosome-associated protein
VVETFILEQGDHIELHDLLKVMGLAPTGGAAKRAIAEGLVMVDGEVETRKRRKVKKGQQVEYGGQKIFVA